MEGGIRSARAKYAFKATNNDELSFQKGDTITLTQPIDGGWWEGTLNGKTGWFPSNYVIELQTDESALSPSSNQINSLTDIPVKEQHHLLVTKHIVESEGEYVTELQNFIKQYLKPLQSADIITSHEYSTFCGNLTDLVSFHQRFLTSLTDCGRLSVSQQKIGGLFLSHASQLQSIYHSYASNHPLCVSLVSQYKEKLSSFVESHGATTPGHQVLISHFSAPFRRLDKYPALLKELERHIDDAHIDRGDTQRAIHVYRELHAVAVDTRKDKEMELEVLSADIKSWEGEDLLSLGDVKLSAHVKIHSEENSTTSDRIILMFPACILMVSVSTRQSYCYQGKLMLGGLKVTQLEDTENYSNALQLSGTMIEELIIAFNSKSKQMSWFDYITKISSQQNEEVEIVSKPKSVTSSTMPPQVTSKARVQTISNSAKTAQVIDSYDRLGFNSPKIWSLSCLRPLPPSRPQFLSRDDTKSPKLQRKASTLGRRKNSVRVLSESSFLYRKIDDSKVLQEDAKILKVIECYCTSARARHTVNSSKSPLRLPQLSEFACVATAVSTAAATPKTADFDDDEPIYELASSILDNPNMLIAEDEKIICEITKDNQTVIEERSLVDTVYIIKDQIRDLQLDYEKLKKDLEDERKARKKLESTVQKNMQSSPGVLPTANLNHNHNSEGNP